MISDFLLNHIGERYSDKSFDVQCCANELNYSKSQLREIVNSTFNTSPQKLIETVRLEAAVRIMCKNNTTIYSVCAASGYSNQKTFRQVVKKRFNLSPSELMEKIANLKNSQQDCETINEELWKSLTKTGDSYR